MVSYLAEGATQTGVKLVRGDSRALQSVPLLTLDQTLPQLCSPIAVGNMSTRMHCVCLF